MMSKPTLVSHTLCPYVQRAAIVLFEKGVPFERVYIDLSNKPDWFKKASPLGKVPLLKTEDGGYLFESAPIVEFLDETIPGQLHPDSPQNRARHRAYIEFASQTLNGIGVLYNAKDEAAFETAKSALRSRFEHMESILDPSGPFFSGADFSLVDAAFAPVFRYFDVFDTFTVLDTFDGLDLVTAWREHLSNRSSVQAAVRETYPADLLQFLRRRGSWITGLLETHERTEQRATA